MLNEELYEITKKALNEREAKRKEGERLERTAIDLEATREAKKIIASLPDRLKKVARSGETSLIVLSSSDRGFQKIDRAICWKIASWARENGLRTNKTEPRTDYDTGQIYESFSISWHPVLDRKT